MYLTTVRYDRKLLERAVRTVEGQFPDEIQHIRYTVGEDWAYDPAVFFRVLLRDSPTTQMAGPDETRGRLVYAFTSKISNAVSHEVGDGDDLQPYFSFRTVSEQETLRDPAWD
jgi:hypothetical protein